MNAQELKNSILQRAIEGKLVPQMSDEGDANELLAEIRAEKERLIKEKKIKRTKALPSIEEDEKPFAIPESWAWVRIGTIFTLQAGKNISASNIFSEKNNEHQFLCYGGNGVRGYVKNFNRCGEYPIIGRQGALCGNVHLAKGTFYATEHAVVTELYGNVNANWAVWFLRALDLNQYATATAQPGLAVKTINSVLIPLPPLAEQKRIVKKIEELLPYIEQYDKAHTKLSTLNAKFPEQMKKSLLQYAMEGKLVSQRTEDGTADELLAEIRAEKERLVKEKKIKKTKPLPEIRDDEKPFEIPENWRWVRLQEICYPFRYGTSAKSEKKGKMPVLRMGNIQHGEIDYANLVFSNDDKEIDKYLLEKNDLLFNRTNSREWVGKTAIYRGEQPAIFAGYLIQVKTFINSFYLNYVMNSEYEREYCKHVKSDGINQSNVNAQKLAVFAIPVPPLAEQKRIVARLEELLPYCDKLSGSSTIK